MTENSENLNSQAIELASRGEYPEAIACFVRAISMDRTNYLLWYNLGVTYRDSGNLAGAKEALEKAYDLNDTDTDILESLSLICLSQGEFEDAFDYCTEGLSIHQENAHLWNTLGVLHFQKHNFDKASEAFESAVTIDPHYYDALFNLRDTYTELGNTIGAQECATRLSKLTSPGGGIFYA